jgi:hypothetical protein
VARLIGALTERRPGGVALVGLDGIAAGGKTALAVHVATAVRDAYPDGQLFVDLGGSGDDPAEPGAVLAHFLRAYGIVGPALPDRIADRAALWRSILADRQVLIVLDDVRDGDQIEPLLPGAPGSAALITSIPRLWRPAGVAWHTVGLLTDDEAWALLASGIGTARLAQDPAATRRMIAMTDGHPLMLRIFADRIAGNPGLTIAQAEQAVIAELTAPAAVVRDCIETEDRARRPYRRLAPHEADAFRRLAVLDLDEITIDNTAAALGIARDRAAGVLVTLHRFHLIEGSGPDRYRMLQIVRGAGRGLAASMHN